MVVHKMMVVVSMSMVAERRMTMVRRVGVSMSPHLEGVRVPVLVLVLLLLLLLLAHVERDVACHAVSLHELLVVNHLAHFMLALALPFPFAQLALTLIAHY